MIPKKLITEIEKWISERRYGSIKINFNGGKIVNINRIESVKVEMVFSNSRDTTVEITPLDA